MKKIRNQMFETNSSSTQSLSIIKKPKDEKWRTEEEIIAEDEKNEDIILGDDITRELRSKFSKIIIMYQMYVNHYINRKSYLFEQMASINGVEYEEPDYINDIYYESYSEFMTLEKEEMTDEEIEKFDGFVEELEANDIELDKIRTYLLEQADTLDEDKDEAKRLMDEVDKDPVDDETCIGYFFSNSLLDFYRGITGIDDLFKPLGLKYTDGYLALIKKIVEDDDIYFLTKEGCMAEDDLPRIM